MVDPILFNSSFSIARMALDGLALRRDIISQNIANVDTPGYRAQEVDFESALQRASNAPYRLSLAVTHAAHQTTSDGKLPLAQVSQRTGGSMRADQNNVDIDRELLELTETGIRYQAITQVVGKKYNLIKSISS